MASFLKFIMGVVLLALVACGQPTVFYVSPDGDDTNNGTKEEPFQTLDRAKLAVRNVLSKKTSGDILIYFTRGIYPMTQAVIFSKEDSGSEKVKISYKACDDEIPAFTGSKIIVDWQKLGDKSELEKLNPSVCEKIYVADLKKAGITDYGDPTDEGLRPELICNGSLQTLARWPNRGFVQVAKAKGVTKLPSNYSGMIGFKEGIFEYKDAYQDRWAQEPDVRLSGYWYWDWSDAFHKVEKWDAGTKTVQILRPWHNYGYRDNANYFGLNMFCEIDQPCEWYLNRETGKIYWYPPENINPAEVEVRLTCFSGQFMVEIHDCSNLTFEGLTFVDGKGSAILIKNGQNNLLADCLIERFGKDGIHIEDGVGHGVSGCFLSSFGFGGMKISGGDRKTLTPGNHFVEHTIVEHFSLFKRTYEPAVHLSGCGNRISNNRFRYSSSSAMRLEGNDFLIEKNEVSHVVSESDDQGGIDVWYNPSYRGNIVRYNYWSDIVGGTRHGAAAVRLDDMISGFHIYGNLFVRCGFKDFGAVQIHGGKDNTIENNVFYDCTAAVSFSRWSEEGYLRAFENPVVKKKIYEDVDILSDLYQTRYPELKNIKENVNENTIIRNLIVSCNEPYKRNNDQQIIKDNVVIDAEGKGFENFYNEQTLAKHGLKPIPVDQIGPINNKWK